MRNYCPAGGTNEDSGSVSVTKDLREVIEKMAVLENEKKVQIYALEMSIMIINVCTYL